MRVFLFALAVLFAVASTNSARVLPGLARQTILDEAQVISKFQEFQVRFNKSYATPSEAVLRLKNFRTSLQRIQELNAKEEGTAVYAVNKFSDMSADEFRQKYLMPKGFFEKNTSRPPLVDMRTAKPYQNITADSFDWRSKGAITPVKNQGQCGSCWAFSASETIESYHKLAGHELIWLSEQQLVSCDKTSDGCNGGWPERAYEYVKSNGGLDTGPSYPYTAQDGTCKKGTVGARIKSYSSVTTSKDESTMKEWISNHGPISICVDAESWQHYSGGVLKSCGTQVDHCVQLTGYDGDAWNVRNSWGEDWGEKGYIQLAYGHNTCAIASSPTVVAAE